MAIYDLNLWRFFQEKSESTPPKSVSMSDRFKLFWAIFGGLDHLHKNNLKHLDIKLSNVMIMVNSAGDFDGQNCVITDFGIGGQKDKETRLAGTPGFASPEQLISAKVGMESDLYSLGRLMVFLFAEWKTAWAILFKPIQEPVSMSPESRKLLILIRRLLKVSFLQTI